jgi:hypothetical protein
MESITSKSITSKTGQTVTYDGDKTVIITTTTREKAKEVYFILTHQENRIEK